MFSFAVVASAASGRSCRLRAGFEIDEESLHLRVGSVLADRPVCAHDAMDGDDDRERRRPAGGADGSGGARPAGQLGDLAVGRGLPVRDRARRLEGLAREPVREPPVQLDVERTPDPVEVLGELDGEPEGIVVDERRGDPVLVGEALERALAWPDVEGCEPGIGPERRGLADRRVDHGDVIAGGAHAPILTVSADTGVRWCPVRPDLWRDHCDGHR